MDEEEWLTCGDPERMSEFIWAEASERKARLFVCAACRDAWPRLTDQRSRDAVSAAELFADGLLDKESLQTTRQGAVAVEEEMRSHISALPYRTPEWGRFALTFEPAKLASDASRSWLGRTMPRACGIGIAPSVLTVLLRDIFGNPFRPATFSPDWRTATAVAIARGMYESREFGAMPILADALQDAGCDHADILSHCRTPGEHVRGCWVVDLVLGKE